MVHSENLENVLTYVCLEYGNVLEVRLANGGVIYIGLNHVPTIDEMDSALAGNVVSRFSVDVGNDDTLDTSLAFVRPKSNRHPIVLRCLNVAHIQSIDNTIITDNGGSGTNG